MPEGQVQEAWQMPRMHRISWEEEQAALLQTVVDEAQNESNI
jgi:hypothetical protein